MLNQKCTIKFGPITGYVIDAVTRRQIRGGVSVDVIIAWDDGDITTFPVSETPLQVQIESVLNSICRVTKNGNNGSIMLFTESKVMKNTDSSVNAIILWDNSTVSVEQIQNIQSIVSENMPSTVPVGSGSGSGLTPRWVLSGTNEYTRSTAGFARVTGDSASKGVDVYIEKAVNDSLWTADLGSRYLSKIELSEDSRYLGIYMKKNKNGSDTHVAYLKNMVDGISITLYEIKTNGGLAVVTDFGLVLDTVLDDTIPEPVV